MVNWISKLLCGRTKYPALGGSKTTRAIGRRTSQGGVLFPLLWNLMINELLVTLEQNGYEAIPYVEDTVLMIARRFVDTIRDRMQLALGNVRTWTSGRGLRVNPVKTQVVLFTRRYKPLTFPPMKLNGTELKLKQEAQFLELILDRKLSWKSNTIKRIN